MSKEKSCENCKHSYEKFREDGCIECEYRSYTIMDRDTSPCLNWQEKGNDNA